METRKIGSLTVSTVGLGCNNFGMRIDEAETASVVGAALDAGITLFDTADVYGATKSEVYLGKALAGRRDEAVVATKFGAPLGEGKGGGGAAWVKQAAEDSLRRLGVDVIDLYQLHMPDQSTPIEETLGALNELVTAGKVREIGCSNFGGALIDGAAAAASAGGLQPFASAQNNMSLLQQRGIQDDLLPACERHGLGVLPYFPLASGLLTGKYKRAEPPPSGTRLAGLPEERRDRVFSDRNWDAVERLQKWAAERDHTLLELAFAWLLAYPEVASVIAGATKPEQVGSNVAAGAWSLTPAERDEVAALAREG